MTDMTACSDVLGLSARRSVARGLSWADGHRMVEACPEIECAESPKPIDAVSFAAWRLRKRDEAPRPGGRLLIDTRSGPQTGPHVDITWTAVWTAERTAPGHLRRSRTHASMRDPAHTAMRHDRRDATRRLTTAIAALATRPVAAAWCDLPA